MFCSGPFLKPAWQTAISGDVPISAYKLQCVQVQISIFVFVFVFVKKSPVYWQP